MENYNEELTTQLYDGHLGPDKFRLLISHSRHPDSVDTKQDILSYQLETYERLESPTYNALSYAWHEPFADTIKEEPVVLINGLHIKVTPNLFYALQKIDEVGGDSDSPYWWVDALCINQNDRAEQECHVALMHEIYRDALYVIVWLGPDPKNDVYDVREFGRFLLARYEEDDELIPHGNRKYEEDFLDHDVEHDYQKYGLPPSDAPIWMSMLKFWERSWFQRIWVQQEVALAETAQIYCGSVEFTLDEVIETSRFFIWSGLSNALIPMKSELPHAKVRDPRIARERVVGGNAVGIDEDRALLRGTWTQPNDSRLVCDRLTGTLNSDNHPILRVFAIKMYLAGTHEASDPRDKVFATLVLMNQIAHVYEIDSVDIDIDYKATVGDVFRTATAWIITHSRCIGILAHLPLYVELEDRKGGCSWSPDYSLEAGQAVSVLINTEPVDGAPVVQIPDIEHQPIIDGPKLYISAKMAGRITHLGDSWRAFMNGCLELTARVLLSCPLLMPKYGNISRLEVWRKTTCGEPYIESDKRKHLASNSRQAFNQWLVFFILREIRNGYAEGRIKSAKEVLTKMPSFELLAETDTSTPKTLPDWAYWQKTLPDGQLVWDLLDHRPMFSDVDLQGRVLCRIVSERGIFLGYGPESMREDDELWIAAGAALPLAMRKRPKVDSDEASWAVLGEVYMINHTELVGELQDVPWQRITLV